MKISKSKRFQVFERDNFTCQYCGRRVPTVVLQVDHQIPQSQNGDSVISNLITSCSECNNGKGGIDYPNLMEIGKLKEQIDAVCKQFYNLHKIRPLVFYLSEDEEHSPIQEFRLNYDLWKRQTELETSGKFLKFDRS